MNGDLMNKIGGGSIITWSWSGNKKLETVKQDKDE